MTIRPEIVVDLAAIRHNVRRLAEIAAPADLMVVVKADGYGHGMVEVARAAREAGATWIGVATYEEAFALRAAGDLGRLAAWLAVPGEDYAAAIEADIDVSAYSLGQLHAIVQAATDRVPRVHLKVDTGLSRGGAPRTQWAELFGEAAALERAGRASIVGLWTHPASADDPDDVANAAQEQQFREAIALAEQSGLAPEVCHFANSATTILRPSCRFDLVRCGIATYGLDPAPGRTPEDLDLKPAMTVISPLALTKRIEPGVGVSYSHRWVSERSTKLGLVPLGYADGIPRSASDVAQVGVAGARAPIRGRVCMDQFVVDLTDLPAVSPGTRVTIFGDGAHGEPTAQDWAEACDTISYEIVTRIGGRLHRRHVNASGSN